MKLNGAIDLQLDELLKFNPNPTQKRIICETENAKGFMVSKFILLPSGVKLMDIQGDCKGVTGYDCEELKEFDIMKALGLDEKSVERIYKEVEEKGICNKKTFFTQKSGEKVEVFSTVLKLFENMYVEITSLYKTVIAI